MAMAKPDIAAHYSRGHLLDRLRATLAAEGGDPDHPTLEALAPHDQFHGRGLDATEEVAGMLAVKPTDRILDIGSGIGGPARYFARRFGCRVVGIDLTPEFCEVARVLTRALGLEDRVSFEVRDALKMPFADASFDSAYSMNVSMNIADKDGLYREIHRVLKPGAPLVLSELARGPGPEPRYPTPWAKTADSSFLAIPAETRRRLEANGFTIVTWRETVEEALAYNARARAMIERGEKPPHRAVALIHGELAKEMGANTGRALADGGLVPIEILCRKRA
jgi:ubiquinone/menaquinone biosynthesis C-methylase UbiE